MTTSTKSLQDYSDAVQQEVARTREIVSNLHAELPRWQLVVWTAGNVSQRVVVDKEAGPGPEDLFVIKPSGVSYDELTPEAMVVCNTEGDLIEGTRSPSSDTAAHAYVYKHMDTVGGIVHTHSTYACAWAALGEEVPCVLTMMADEFGGPVPIGPSKSPAVLMQNHGPFTIGKDGRDAVKAAVMVEEVSKAAHLARTIGTPQIVPDEAIDALYDRYQNVYGQ